MYNNIDYPWGADGPGAPWNEVEQEEIDVCMTVHETVRKETRMSTKSYMIEEDDDTGAQQTVLDEHEIEVEYDKYCYSIAELLAILHDMAKERLDGLEEMRHEERSRSQSLLDDVIRLRGIIRATEGWEFDDRQIEDMEEG